MLTSVLPPGRMNFARHRSVSTDARHHRRCRIAVVAACAVLFQTNLAALLLQLGQNAEALPHAERAVALDPNSAPAQFCLGAALWREGDLDRSERHLQAALRLQPDRAAAREMLRQIAEKRAGARPAP